MKFFISFLLTGLLSFAACLFLPWWSVSIAAFIVAALIPQGPGRSFLTGFTALFLLWAALSFWISNNNDNILAHKVSPLVLFKMDSPFLLILTTALIGALVAGFGALAGSYLRKTKA